MLTQTLRIKKWLALSVPLCFATYVGAQTAPGQSPTRDNDVDATRPAPDREINHGDLARFDQFLDSHREIAEQLRKDPSLAGNKRFLKDHPELQNYLRQNPQIRDALKDDPNTFMSAEERFERNEVDRGELANFDRFLDAHREIATQLRKDPSLVDNRQYLKDHPELQSYLQNHPEIRQQIDRNPDAFMHQEESYDRFEDSRYRNNDANGNNNSNRNPSANGSNYGNNSNNANGANNANTGSNANAGSNGNRTATANSNNNDDNGRADIGRFDQFLDSHREIAEQLRKNPSLADNQQFLKDHPALQSYLQQNPSIRQRLEQNPNAFMSSEAYWEHSGDDRTQDRQDAYNRDRNNGNDNDRDRGNGVADNNRDLDRDRDVHRRFGEFLGSHQDIAAQLSRNPSLCKDHDYLQNHPDLQTYLNDHPDVRQQLTSDPDTFMKSTQQFNTNGQKTPTPAATQPGTPTQPKPYKQ
jgi:hypothetical protein